MRSIAYALLGFGMFAFGALTPAPASADCYRNCGGEYRPMHRHHPVVRYHQRAHYARPFPYVEDSVPYDDEGYDGYSRPYANGYYVSSIGGFGGAYRGLVSWHRYGHYDAGRHGFVGYRHAGFGGFHRFR